MANVVLGLATVHAPFLNGGPERWAEGGKRDMADARGGGMPMNLNVEAMIKERASWIEKELQPEVWQQRHEACQRAIGLLADKLAEVAPDVVVVVGDDTHEVFMPEDHIPSVDVFWGNTIPYVPFGNRRSGTADATLLEGHPGLGQHLIESLVEEGFDPSHTRAVPEGRSIGHAFDFVYARIMKGNVPPHVPIWLNTYYAPNQPTMRRCHDLGKGVRRAIESWDSDARVAVIGTGGLSHLVIDEELDRGVLDAMQAKDEQRLISFPEDKLTFGTSEIRNWVVAAGAMHESEARMTLLDYVPCYRSPAGTGCACAFAYWE
jgi:hypothetical protein